MSNICFFLNILMIPLSFGLIDLQSTLPLSSAGHTVLEILILLVIYWMIWLINRFDRWLYLHSYIPGTKNLVEQNRTTEASILTSKASIPSGRANNKNPTQQVVNPVLDPSTGFDILETRITIGKLTQKIGR